MSTDPNRALVAEDLEWLRDHLRQRSTWYQAQVTEHQRLMWERIDRILAALSSHQEGAGIEAVKRAAYQEGWNDREGDLIAGADRVVGSAADTPSARLVSTNRSLEPGDMEWLRATINDRRLDIRTVNSGIAKMRNDRINRLLAAISPQEGVRDEEREAVARLEDVLAMLDLYHKTGLTIAGRKLYPADLRLILSRRPAMGSEGGA